MTKVCSKCGVEKDIEEFSRSKVTKSGFASWCKQCNREDASRRWEARKGSPLAKRTKKDSPKSKIDGYRICIVCGKDIPIELFEKDARKEDGHTYRCLDCSKKLKQEWAVAHKDVISENRRKKKNADPEQYKQAKHDEYMRHRETYRESGKRYYEDNKYEFIQQCIAYKKRRYKEFPHTKIADNMRQRVRAALKGMSKAQHTLEMLGCTIEEYKAYLEQHFTERMSWDNYSFYGWHIDHIKPLAMFDLSDPEEQKKAFHYSNTQPLWWTDNLKKGARYIG